MGKSAGKWIKTLLFGKKHSKSNYSKNDKKGALKSPVEDPARDSSFIRDQLSDRGVEKFELEKGTSASQCDAVGVAYVDQGRQERAEAEYDAILVSSKQKLPLIDDREHAQRSIEENTDTDPSTSYTIVPSKSNDADVALGRLKPKSSESNLSTFKLTPSMLHGQALGSIEDATSSHKFESGAGLLNTHDSTPQDQGKIDENGPVETSPPSDHKNNSDSAVSIEASLDDVENGLSQRQNKAAFRMSVLEDYVDSDDDVPSIGGSLDSKFSPSEEPKLFEPIHPKLKSHSDLILSNTNEAVAGAAPSGERNNGFTTPASISAVGSTGGATAPINAASSLFGSSPSSSPFSFSSAPASVFSSISQPVFGNPAPSFGAPSPGNNFQMNGEDSMAEASPAPSGFMFGSAAPSQPNNPFAFGGQQNQAPPPNPSMFQASNSLDFNAGGSFSLGSGGVDKSGRKFVKANRNKNRKK